MSDTKKSSHKAESRTRNYACMVYPESAPENWLDIIAEAKIPVMVSPLHDRDIDPQGQPKKPHYHVMVCYEGPKTEKQARDFCQSFGGVGLEAVQSLRGYARYLCHLDNPEKAQYDPEAVRCFGSADYFSAINLPTNKYAAVREMMSWCRENGIIAYSDLLDYASECRMDWFRELCDCCTVVMKEYLKSREWKNRNGYGYHSGGDNDDCND